LDDELVAGAGVWLSSSVDMEIAYDIGARIVKQGRERWASFSYMNYLYEKEAHLGTVTYRRKGPGRKAVTAIYDPRIVPDIEAWLVKRLGKLAELDYMEEDDVDAEVAAKWPPARKGAPTPHLDIPEGQVDVAAKGKPASHMDATASSIIVGRRELAAIGIATDSEPLNSADAAANDPLTDHMELVANRASTHFTDSAARAAAAEYTGGIVPEAMRIEIRDAYQTAGITQAQAAEMLGLSRPHLANALAGRYSLSKAKVVQLHAFLAQPPPIVAPRLL